MLTFVHLCDLMFEKVNHFNSFFLCLFKHPTIEVKKLSDSRVLQCFPLLQPRQAKRSLQNYVLPLLKFCFTTLSVTYSELLRFSIICTIKFVQVVYSSVTGNRGQTSYISEGTPKIWISSCGCSWVWSARTSVGSNATCQAIGDRITIHLI